MAYSKRHFRKKTAKKRLTKRKTYKRRHSRHRHQRGRGVGFSAPLDDNNNFHLESDLIRFAIKDNPDLKQMLDEIPKPPDSYSGPARSAEEQEINRQKMREYRQKRDNILLSWFETHNNGSDYNKVIEYLTPLDI